MFDSNSYRSMVSLLDYLQKQCHAITDRCSPMFLNPQSPTDCLQTKVANFRLGNSLRFVGGTSEVVNLGNDLSSDVLSHPLISSPGQGSAPPTLSLLVRSTSSHQNSDLKYKFPNLFYFSPFLPILHHFRLLYSYVLYVILTLWP